MERETSTRSLPAGQEIFEEGREKRVVKTRTVWRNKQQ
jgi:hypothetical protein